MLHTVQAKHAETFLWTDLREEDSGEIFLIILAKERQKTLHALRHTAYLQNKQKPKFVVVTMQDFCIINFFT